MKIKSVSAISILAFALVTGAASPSFAAEAATPPDNSSLAESTSTEGSANTGSPVTLEELQQLSEIQSTEEAAAVIASASASNPVSVLMDDFGSSVAAIATPATGVSVFAITPVGPGCSSTSACIYPYNGYQGTGVLAIKISGNKTFAGDRPTTFWVGNTGNFAAADVTLNYSSTRTFTSISRS